MFYKEKKSEVCEVEPIQGIQQLTLTPVLPNLTFRLVVLVFSGILLPLQAAL